ncbi:MAG: MBL fold metallo-hydrolase [Bryobacterales bacterium]|nr:MBL fold metallo-hydrolase [Bryobacterales bacterium]
MRRKDFLQLIPTTPLATGALSAAAEAVRVAGPTVFDPSRRHERDFAPTGALKPLSANLYVYEDCVNVYIVKRGARAAIINFGTGDVLKVLPRIGVKSVDRVLVTHHHRDAVQGLADAGEYRFLVTVPRAEARYFQNVEAFWQNAGIYLNYDLRSHWNTLRRSVAIAGQVAGGDEVEWEGYTFRVVETPGVTEGSVSYSAEIDGRRVVFTGDLIAGAGKVNNWFDLHWAYYGFTQGIDASEKSFERVRAESPAMLLPAHGDPIPQPEVAMRENSRIYTMLRGMLPPNSTGRTRREMRHILPHLIHAGGPECQNTGVMTTYAILTGTGKALFYDYGYVDLDHIRKLKRDLGITHAVITFSHYHDDHLIRTFELMRDDNIEIWVLDKMADVVENPTRHRLPCLVPFPIKPTRVVRDGERIEWEGYTLEFFHMPGQTEYHQGLAVRIDGRKVMFTGDNTWKKADPTRIRSGPLVPQNVYFLDGGFITCARKMLEYLPDIVCPAHTEEYSPSKEDLEGFVEWAYNLREVMTGLIAQPDPNFGMDYRWLHFYPARQIAGKGEFDVELRLRNHLFRPGTIRVELKHGAEVVCAAPVRTVRVAAKTEVAVPFTLRRVAGFGRRAMVMADITFNGRRLGEAAELVVD